MLQFISVFIQFLNISCADIAGYDANMPLIRNVVKVHITNSL